ncbi:MAG: hypothetical protein KME11_04805 [Timaviella obliquedivisa GSE-PSE-MK23-08B]|jgi:hypothetical protein|nr:hypothetical protein [Timaviella obliquedivisa GSE-PSE-MK23-08B]
MAGWKGTEKKVEIANVKDVFPADLECDYVDPALGRSLVEHLKSYWLIRQLYRYADGYEANKIKEILEPQKFTIKDWTCIAKVCGFGMSWSYRQIELAEAGLMNSSFKSRNEAS